MKIGVWYRVWIALAGAPLLSSALIAMGKRDLHQTVSRQSARELITPPNCVPMTVDFREKAVIPGPGPSGFILDADGANYRTETSCASWRLLSRHLLAGLGIALLLLVAGLTLGWISRGFEKATK